MLEIYAVSSFEQDQLQRWILDGEVGVAGFGLGRAGAEHLCVEADCLVNVPDVESELQTHDTFDIDIDIDIRTWTDVRVNRNGLRRVPRKPSLRDV